MTLISFFIQGSALGITAGAAPGPLQTYLISETLSGGWRRSLPLIFVPVLSDTPVVILTIFVLGQMPDIVLRVISLVGGIFVFYLAWTLWKQWRITSQEVELNGQTSHRSFLKAVAMNLLNPNPYIFWTFVSGPLLLEAFDISWTHAIAFLTGFYGIFMGTMVILIALFHQTRKFGPRVVRIFQLISILILVVFGGILIKEGIIVR